MEEYLNEWRKNISASFHIILLLYRNWELAVDILGMTIFVLLLISVSCFGIGERVINQQLVVVLA